MILKLKREIYTPNSTIGTLSVNDDIGVVGVTLEDAVRRSTKIVGKTAIPTGAYEVVLTYSNRFQKVLPLLLGVPNFSGIRIHTGNGPTDTQGCILIGQRVTPGEPDRIMNSRLAFGPFMALLRRAVEREKIYIEVSDKP